MTPASEIDRAELRSIVDKGLMTNPYNEFETLAQKVETLKDYLVSVAREEEEATYDDVSSNCGIYPTRRGVLLGILGLHEDRLGNPPLPAIVCSAEEGKTVGDGYWIMAEKTDGLIDLTPESEAARQALWRVHRNSVFREWGERQTATR